MSDNAQDVVQEAAAAVVGTSLFSTFDIVMLIVLLGAAVWWLYSSRKENKDDKIVLSKYSIQTAGSIQVAENSFIKKLKSSGRSLVVFYGSQTGTGEEFAGRLAKEGVRYKMKGMVADPEECDMVLCALSFYATGSYQRIVGMAKYLGQTTVSKYVKEVTDALNSLQIINKFIKFPVTRQDRELIREKFYTKYGFPGVIGCVDGSHFHIFSPNQEEEHIFFCRKHYYSINVQMEELTKLQEIPNSLAVFCMATYGEGDPTDNAMEFYEWLKNGEPDLTGLNYAVFGLGNKTYEHYNAVAIYLDKRLEELGATRVYECGLGDDDANIEDDFITWKDRFWPAVCDKFNIESTGEEELMRQFRLVTHKPDEIPPENIFTGEIARLHTYQVQRPPYDAKNPFLAQITVNRELHKGGDRSCLHVELDISDSKMRYEAGDHIAIYPINDNDLVDRLGALTGADMDEIFSLINTDLESSKKHPFPCPTSYRTALSHYLEITALPRTHILRELAEYCTDEEDKKKLLLMATNSPEGKALYQSFVVDACRNIVHILEDIKSCKPALDHLCELLPRLQPRYYSISSSPKLHPETVHITAVVVQYKTSTGRVNKGVATTWLAQHKPEAGRPLPRVPVYIRKSQFRLPLQTQTPIIMVGPGTGLAPFRGFLQERAFARANGKDVGENILYFGCRHRNEDFIYQEELEKYEKNGDVELHVAFSRDQDHKVYVTHLLQQNIEKLWDVIGNRNGHFYVCGDAKNMAVDVRNIVLKAVQEKGGKTEAEAVQFLKKLDSMKKYSSDVWS